MASVGRTAVAAGVLLRSSLCSPHTRTISSSACVFGIKSRWVAPTRKEIFKRQKKMELKGIAHNFRRSEYIEWNYEAELHAFGKRLQEEFDDSLLREALTDNSYVTQERKRQQGLGVSDPALTMDNNARLAGVGETVIEDYCTAHLRGCLPLLPEEGISALVEYLLSEEVMSTVGFGIGLRDLVFCQEYPPSPATMAQCFKAVVGVLSAGPAPARCHAFVRDFVVSQLVGKDVTDVWKIENPMGVLSDILQQSNRGEPEPRLIFTSGQKTLQAVYQIGVYSDKKFLGSGYGETVDTAVEQAALDALLRFFRITASAPPLPFGPDADTPRKEQTNMSLRNWSIDKAKNVFVC